MGGNDGFSSATPMDRMLPVWMLPQRIQERTVESTIAKSRDT